MEQDPNPPRRPGMPPGHPFQWDVNPQNEDALHEHAMQYFKDRGRIIAPNGAFAAREWDDEKGWQHVFARWDEGADEPTYWLESDENVAQDGDPDLYTGFVPYPVPSDQGDASRPTPKPVDHPTDRPVEDETIRMFAKIIVEMGECGILPRITDRVVPQDAPMEERAKQYWRAGMKWGETVHPRNTDAHHPADGSTATFVGFHPQYHPNRRAGRGWHGYDQVYNRQMAGTRLRPEMIDEEDWVTDPLQSVRYEGPGLEDVEVENVVHQDNPLYPSAQDHEFYMGRTLPQQIRDRQARNARKNAARNAAKNEARNEARNDAPLGG